MLARNGPDLFLYAAPAGHPELREVVAGRLRDLAVDVTHEEVVLCHGASQGIALAIRLLAAAGDAVAVEVPTYHNVMASLDDSGRVIHLSSFSKSLFPGVRAGAIAVLGRVVAARQLAAPAALQSASVHL